MNRSEKTAADYLAAGAVDRIAQTLARDSERARFAAVLAPRASYHAPKSAPRRSLVGRLFGN